MLQCHGCLQGEQQRNYGSYKSDFAAVRFMDSWMSISLVTCQDAETKPAIIESGAQWRKLLGSTV